MNKENVYKMTEARKNFAEIILRVLNGEEILITKYNLPVVKVVKIDEDNSGN